MEFSASLDPQSRRITWFVHGMIALVFVFWADSYLEPGGISMSSIWYLFLPVFPLYAYFLLTRPLGYRIVGQTLELRRPLGSKHMALKDIVRCEPVSAAWILSSKRLLGMNGFHGYSGRFRHASGTFDAWATRLDRLVLLELRSGKRYLLSPDEPLSFMHACQPPEGVLG